MFNYINHHGSIRLMTVIQGIPFYRSTGKNSKNSGTWLPFLGVRISNPWLIKPSNHPNNFPPEVMDFLLENNIADEITLKRFGNLQTICISASIGTGYWQTKNGNRLKDFLYTKYFHYFLDKNSSEQLNQQADLNHINVTEATTVNRLLKRINPLIPLNHIHSRLPFANEINLSITLSREINTALSMMLTRKQNTITPMEIRVVETLSKNTALMKLALDNDLFEDTVKIEKLHQALMDAEKISEKDVRTLISLKHIPLIRKEANDLIHHKFARNALRVAHENKYLNRTFIALIRDLSEKNILSQAKTLLENISTRNLISRLFDKQALCKKNIKTLRAMFDIKVVKKGASLFENESGRRALYLLRKNRLITKKHVLLIKQLAEMKWLDKAMPLLEQKLLIKKLLKLQDQSMLTQKVIDEMLSKNRYTNKKTLPQLKTRRIRNLSSS